jgi:hypothetical protein
MMGEGTGTVYRIVVRSELSDRYAVAFEGMKMETKDGETILTGRSSTSRTFTASSIA